MNIDTHSQTWRAVKLWAEQELLRQREDLESLTISTTRADQCRGAIEQLKKLIERPNVNKPTGFIQP
jgi:predicted XRE-type DNA-binding protein